MSLLGNQFNKVRVAARTALDRTQKITGTENNPVAIYERLTPAHFDAIAQVYGQDNLMKYIKTMEARKIRGTNG